jgi:hypothetical protein
MNHESKENITITITGQLTISRAALTEMLRSAQPPPAKVEAPVAPAAPQAPAAVAEKLPEMPTGKKGVPRLAFTRRETAEVLGISPASVDRLAQRGLLQSSAALKKPLFARSEIERFLKETSRSNY